jgi:hypothetical protein
MEFATNESGSKKSTLGASDVSTLAGDKLHPAWLALIRYCAELQHGEIERLKIQDGLPTLAEVTTKKVKFG